MKRIALKKKRFNRRRLSIKRKIKTGNKLRLCISRSNKNYYCQIIDDIKGMTMVSASTLEKEFPSMKNKGNMEAAKILGRMIADRAIQAGIKKVVFDRNGYLYHGKVKSFADSARENGLEF